MLIMREAHYGTRRFDDFADRVGLSPATTATYLRSLTDAALLIRQPYQDEGMRTRNEYVLTASGMDLLPIVIALFEWGTAHADGNDELEFAHIDCGEPATVQLECAAGHVLDADAMELRSRAQNRA
jgi:DNA-binding HxlR family transcriptional regulator